MNLPACDALTPAEGAAWLDQVLPEWYLKVDLDLLDQSNPYR